MLTRLLSVLVLASAFAYPRALHAQPQEGDVVAAVQAAYQRLDYESAEALALAALERDDLHVEARTELHTLVALIAFIRDDLDVARRHFELALDLDPDLALDPLLVSPKALDFFDEVRLGYAERRRQAGPVPELRYVVVRDSRPEAALRSMLLPGWGQLHRGERARGWVLIGLWGVTATGSVYAHTRYVRARNAYLDEQVPALVRERYETSDAWYKARNNLVLGAACVWLVGQVDALLGRADAPSGRQQAHLVPIVAPARGQLGLRLHF